MMSFNEAQQTLQKFVAPFCQNSKAAVRKNLQQCLGLTLAQDIYASCDVPKDNVSAMDGYAIFCEPNKLSAGSAFPITAKALAGHPLPQSQSFESNSCIRIMTGATVPKEACTVVIQENIHKQDNHIVLKQAESAAKNIRFKGEEIQQSSLLLKQGTVIEPQHISLLCSQGIDQLLVYPAINIGIFATGDELVEPGLPLAEGKIYEANILSSLCLLKHLPAKLTNLGIVKDQPEKIKALLANTQSFDLIISCGGVSVGDSDYVKQVISELGHIEHHKVAMKPGKPIAFGAINDTVIMALPGNPVSAFITLQQFFMPAIWQLCGYKKPYFSQTINAQITQAIHKKSNRREFLRVQLQQNSQGLWQVSLPAKQDSHRVKGLAQANALLIIDEGTETIAQGSWVSVQPFSWSFH